MLATLAYRGAAAKDTCEKMGTTAVVEAGIITLETHVIDVAVT